MSQSSTTQVTKISAATTVPVTKASSVKIAATKDAGRVHVGGSMMRF